MRTDRPRALLTAEEVAAWLAISVKSVYRLAATNSISSIRVGGLLRFAADDVLAYIQGHTTEGADRRIGTRT